MDDLMIKIDNVSKQYKLGQIGGTTMRDELQRLSAKMKGKEDPTRSIGDRDYNKGETFMALDGISFEVKKGERVGIIGHNGAGKSTLLKLISCVTAPTAGRIGLNGRVASMLEVGTGFHAELTGRENIYVNGAILGMTKKEIDAKIEDIIDFSECRQFIDTPVKRYSSGMYVKLAFSVAAHLDSEIMIMDEVLAVGDINFQQKCLKKMKDVAIESGRTILYVSHNMSTIRTLCSRCIVLEKGHLVFDGDVDEAIGIYSKRLKSELRQDYDVSNVKRGPNLLGDCIIKRVFIEKPEIDLEEDLHFSLLIHAEEKVEKCMIRFILFNQAGTPVATTYSDFFDVVPGRNEISFVLSTEELTFGDYIIDFVLCSYKDEVQVRHDGVTQVVSFHIEENKYYYNFKWDHSCWSYVRLNSLRVEGISHEA